MTVQVTIGGVVLTFGYPGGSGAAPFFPYLLNVERVEQASGDSTATASFRLHSRAKDLIDLNVLAPVTIFSASGEVLAEGLIGRLEYQGDISVTVEA